MALDQNTIIRLLMSERDKLLAYIWAIVRDDHLAEDILQEVSILAINKCQDINDINHFHGWMRQTAKHRSLYALRQSKKQACLLDERVLEIMDNHWKQYDQTRESDLVAALRQCLGKLSPYARKLVDLRYFEGLKPARIAEVVDRKVTTVYVALTRIHKSLSECIRHRQSGKGARDV